jgi:hypothetical protein
VRPHILVLNSLPLHQIPYLKSIQMLLVLVIVFIAVDAFPSELLVLVLNRYIHMRPASDAFMSLLLVYVVVPHYVLGSQMSLVVLVEAVSVELLPVFPLAVFIKVLDIVRHEEVGEMVARFFPRVVQLALLVIDITLMLQLLLPSVLVDVTLHVPWHFNIGWLQDGNVVVKQGGVSILFIF